MFNPLQKIFHHYSDRVSQLSNELGDWEFALRSLESHHSTRTLDFFPLEREASERGSGYFSLSIALPWWIKIETQLPACIYYFGPFASEQEARLAQPGYIEDLVAEEARGIAVQLGRGYPQTLTLFADERTFEE